MPSFDEFKRRVLQEEEEKSKQQSAENSSGAAPKPKKLKERKQSNYALVDCGAKILDHNPCFEQLWPEGYYVQQLSNILLHIHRTCFVSSRLKERDILRIYHAFFAFLWLNERHI